MEKKKKKMLSEHTSSGNIKNPMTEFTEGFNTYRIQPIIMQDYNADTLLNHLEEKQKSGKVITKEDLITLVLCPLMNGNTSIKDRINAAYRIIRTTEIKSLNCLRMVFLLYKTLPFA